ncbi:helix-turn-helix transcriptional regulator [Cohnella silvisoli]|uniref:AraC family transcriptional regulator n=1 Tax=Cohnella silvisoli TaxID=2873699 RepID=A0ABV1KVT1_9BACL|nr:helix-turn-helix domain-containing protein [Cohnella silvisoli]MCD9023586.1 AraC family transcriptional regulator [Cohnella silvisoli]
MRLHHYLPKPGFERYIVFPESCGRYHEDSEHAEYRPKGGLGYYNIHLLFEGRGTVTHNGVATELQAGNGFLYAPGELQQYSSDRSEPWDVYWVHFYGAGADALLEGRGRGEPWLFTFGRKERIRSLLDHLLRLSSSYESGNETTISAVLYELLIELLRNSEGLSASPGLDYQERIRKTADRMSEKCGEVWDLDRMANDAGYSPTYFCRLFQRVLGRTPASFLQETRLTRAKQLLVLGGLPVKQVAEQSGYAQSSYFIRRFREREGMTPEQYRLLYSKSRIAEKR